MLESEEPLDGIGELRASNELELCGDEGLDKDDDIEGGKTDGETYLRGTDASVELDTERLLLEAGTVD